MAQESFADIKLKLCYLRKTRDRVNMSLEQNKKKTKKDDQAVLRY